jgi:hypothetical protein
MASVKEELLSAVDAALAGDWHGAHATAQRHEGDSEADWLHAILHKIEGDEVNSHYWYRRTRHAYADFADAKEELAALRQRLRG